MGLFSSFSNVIQGHTALSERIRLRESLLCRNDAELAKQGYSRTLLEAGVQHFPWRADAAEKNADADRARQPAHSDRAADIV